MSSLASKPNVCLPPRKRDYMNPFLLRRASQRHTMCYLLSLHPLTWHNIGSMVIACITKGLERGSRIIIGLIRMHGVHGAAAKGCTGQLPRVKGG